MTKINNNDKINIAATAELQKTIEKSIKKNEELIKEFTGDKNNFKNIDKEIKQIQNSLKTIQEDSSSIKNLIKKIDRTPKSSPAKELLVEELKRKITAIEGEKFLTELDLKEAGDRIKQMQDTLKEKDIELKNKQGEIIQKEQIIKEGKQQTEEIIKKTIKNDQLQIETNKKFFDLQKTLVEQSQNIERLKKLRDEARTSGDVVDENVKSKIFTVAIKQVEKLIEELDNLAEQPELNSPKITDILDSIDAFKNSLDNLRKKAGDIFQSEKTGLKIARERFLRFKRRREKEKASSNKVIIANDENETINTPPVVNSPKRTRTRDRAEQEQDLAQREKLRLEAESQAIEKAKNEAENVDLISLSPEMHEALNFLVNHPSEIEKIENPIAREKFRILTRRKDELIKEQIRLSETTFAPDSVEDPDKTELQRRQQQQEEEIEEVSLEELQRRQQQEETIGDEFRRRAQPQRKSAKKADEKLKNKK
jgi:hypothetical protein